MLQTNNFYQYKGLPGFPQLQQRTRENLLFERPSMHFHDTWSKNQVHMSTARQMTLKDLKFNMQQIRAAVVS